MAEQTEDDIKKSFAGLDYTQEQRRKITDGVLDEAVRNKDPEMLRTAMQALDGMDRVNLGRLKLNEKAKENQSSAKEAEALSGLLIHLAENKSKGSHRSPGGVSSVRGTKLPDSQRPTYDPSIRDSKPTGENTNEFKERMSKEVTQN